MDSRVRGNDRLSTQFLDLRYFLGRRYIRRYIWFKRNCMRRCEFWFRFTVGLAIGWYDKGSVAGE